MFLSPLGERLGEGVTFADRLLHHPLTQPLPQGGEETELQCSHVAEGVGETVAVCPAIDAARFYWNGDDGRG